MNKYFSPALFLAIFFVAAPLFAAEFVVPEKETAALVISEGIFEDVYAGGGSVTVEADISGDLLVGGGSVVIAGNVREDLFVGGGNVTVTGDVSGDIRGAGGTITLSNTTGGDVVLAGGTLTFSGERIGGDLWIAGGSVTINSDVSGDLLVRGGEVLINSTINGDVDVVTESLMFGPQAKVSGAILYKGKNEAVISEGASVSDIQFERTYGGDTDFVVPLVTAGFFIKIIAFIITALVLVKFFGRTLEELSLVSYNTPWKSIAVGIVGIIVIPIVSLLLFFTVIGFYLALLVLVAFVLSLLLACVVTPLFLGALLLKWLKKAPSLVVSWHAAFLGVIVSSLLGLIPLVGWILMAFLFVLVYGGLLRAAKLEIGRLHMKEKTLFS